MAASGRVLASAAPTCRSDDKRAGSAVCLEKRKKTGKEKDDRCEGQSYPAPTTRGKGRDQRRSQPTRRAEAALFYEERDITERRRLQGDAS